MNLIRRTEGRRAFKPFVQSGKALQIPVKKARAVGIILATSGSGTHETWGQLDAWVAAEGLTRVLEQIGWLYEANGTAWSTAEQGWWISQLAPEQRSPQGQSNSTFRYAFPEPQPSVARGRAAKAGMTTLPYKGTTTIPFSFPASFSLRIQRKKLPSDLPTTVTGPAETAQLGRALAEKAKLAEREWFLALGLDNRLNVEAWWVAGVGTGSMVMVLPSNVFAPAVALGSVAGILLVHNHPSGNPTPSAEDQALTARLEQVGELLGIRVIDHLVVADSGYSSMAELGWIAPQQQSLGDHGHMARVNNFAPVRGVRGLYRSGTPTSLSTAARFAFAARLNLHCVVCAAWEEPELQWPAAVQVVRLVVEKPCLTRQQWAAFAALLEDVEERPTLIHCFMGAERTGILAAHAQVAAGVPWEVVLQDLLDHGRGYWNTAEVEALFENLRVNLSDLRLALD